VLDVIRRELRRVSPDVKIDNEEIRQVLVNEVLKRDVVEGEKATEASKKITKASQRLLRALPKPAGSKVIDASQSNSVDDTTTKS